MIQDIKTINFGGVNCFLIKIDSGFVLIDTGYSKNRKDIEQKLQDNGLTLGTLKLILQTHGDYDHTGNSRYLREKYGGKIAIHSGDRGVVEEGNLFYGRDANFLVRGIAKLIIFLLRGNLKKQDYFKADFFVDEGFDSSGFGLEVNVVSLPGHSKGSIGFLTLEGDFFCGDLLVNNKKPAANSMIGDKEAFKKSVQRFKTMKIVTVYPGHGKPFSIEQFLKEHI